MNEYQAKMVLSRVLRAVLGRRRLYRAGRFLTNVARLDTRNTMATNGELMVQCAAFEHRASRESFVAVDVGANVGEWTVALATPARLAELNGRLCVYCFEPCEQTRRILAENISKNLLGANVFVMPQGLSSANDTSATLWLIGDGQGEGQNSLHAQPMIPFGSSVSVELVTLDNAARQCDIDRIDLLKVDTEGHDLAVLEGARGLLCERRIEVVQFEYNSCWIVARRYLRDAFCLFAEYNYSLGKVTPNGIEFYERWRPELESYVEGNYLACTARWLPVFRSVPTEAIY